MIELATERLRLMPLSYEQVKKFILLDNLLEEELAITHSERSISKELMNGITNYTIPWLEKHVEDYLFYTLWIVIRKEDNIIVGDLSFKGAPNENGEIEIGYGTQPAFQNNGYMRESVAEMISWARKQDKVSKILAETRKDNIPSIMILKKNGFEFLRENTGMYWWSLKIKNN